MQPLDRLLLELADTEPRGAPDLSSWDGGGVRGGGGSAIRAEGEATPLARGAAAGEETWAPQALDAPGAAPPRAPLSG